MGVFTDLVSSRNRDAFVEPSRVLENVCTENGSFARQTVKHSDSLRSKTALKRELQVKPYPKPIITSICAATLNPEVETLNPKL